MSYDVRDEYYFPMARELLYYQHNDLTYIHTYIIGHYNPSVRIINLVSHTTYVVCGNFIHKWRLKSTPNDEFLEKLFMTILFTLRVFARNLLRFPKKYFRISFWCLAWDSNPGFSSNKPTHYLLDHGNFSYNLHDGTFAFEILTKDLRFDNPKVHDNMVYSHAFKMLHREIEINGFDIGSCRNCLNYEGCSRPRAFTYWKSCNDCR